jgi:hypothetical protein
MLNTQNGGSQWEASSVFLQDQEKDSWIIPLAEVAECAQT